MKALRSALAVAFIAIGLAACASGGSDFNKPGFYTHVHDGRLWVLKANDQDVAIVAKNQEPKVVVTRIGEGPKGMTIKSNDSKVIDEYLAAK